jgi:hypothetical protein
MSDVSWAMLMYAAARDTRFARVMEQVVREAVDEAFQKAEAGADPELAGRVAGLRFRDALAFRRDVPVDCDHAESALRARTIYAELTSARETNRRANAFRRMAGVRV